MPRIRVLPDIVASQVAAGEVVERPASVVKELVENSIDAGAREVRVDVDKGGMALIRVGDDGCGMSREDALLSLERHATSKLRDAAGLAAVTTLGFRGEAVPSIASVSRFRMVTREADAVAGTEILVEGGVLRDVREAGAAPGTVIEARSLFFNMPARRKFMRAESTEAAHVEHQVRLHALAAPGVRFRLRRDEREVLDLPGVEKVVDRVRQMVGTELARELVELPVTRGNGVVVEGFVLPVAHARKGRRHQSVFLNGRPVEDGVISRALAEGFKGALAEGLYPAAWLWLEMEPGLVDVNVHPAKREVRFHRPVEVREAILEAVAEGLRPKRDQRPESRIQNPGEKVGGPSVSGEDLKAGKRLTAGDGRRPPLQGGWAVKGVQPELPVAVAKSEEEEPVQEIRPRFRMLSMLHRRYALLESEDGLVVFDPKAAKERIFYEALLEQRGGMVETQGLLVPVLLELDPRDLDLLVREREALAEAGVEVEGFGGNTLQVRSLPACLEVGEPLSFMRELVDVLLHEASPGRRFAFERVAKLLARKAAVRAQPKLVEIEGLLEELFRCELPYCAADGRPTLSEISLHELRRRFGGKN